MSARILVVEDNDHNTRLIEQVIMDMSEKIEIAKVKSGEEAIAISKDNCFDLILMDIGLPDMDGLRTTRQIKLLPQYSKTPFMAVTAYARISDEETFREVFDDYISKPIDEDFLVEKILKWIGEKL